MKLALHLLFFLLVPVCCISQSEEDPNIDSLAGDLIKSIRSYDKERILLQTDRRIYSIGDVIYFKACLIDSMRNNLQSSPKKMFVDLVDNQDKVLVQLLLNAAMLKTSGDITLSDSLKEGYYWLRAYTKKMITENIQDICVVPVYIVNPFKKNLQDDTATATENNIKTKPIIQFFPEGGSIISGINSTVAIKTTNENGLPLIVSGIVKDNHDTAVAKFVTNDKGLGKFSFYPVWYNKYTLYIQNRDSYDSIMILPSANFFAAQLAVAEQNENFVKARVTLEDSIYSKDFVTYLFGVSNDSLCFASIGRGMYNANIPLDNFPHGIARLLLFDKQKKLLSERDIYVNKENSNISIYTNKQEYASRENVKLAIEIMDRHNRPLISTLAIAVTDSRITDSVIETWKNDPLRNYSSNDADLVMLCRKKEYTNWFSANPVTAETKQEDDDTAFTISGKVVNRKNEPVPGHVVTILSNKNTFLLETDTTDANGRFKFYLPDYSDSTQFSFQVSNRKGRKEDGYTILYDTVYIPHFSTPAYLKTKFKSGETLGFVKSQLYHIDSVIVGTGQGWLKPVTVKAYTKKEVNYDETKRVSNFSHIVTREMIGQGFGMVGYSMLMVSGMHLMNGFLVIGGPNGFSPKPSDEPIVVLDGSIVDLSGDSLSASPVLNFLNTIPVSTIDFIEVLGGAEAAIYGMRGGHGAIVINTGQGKRTNNVGGTGLQSVYPKGFHASKAFNMPDYNNKEIKKSKLPDLRKTIYWNGDIITDKEGKASINFFTADTPTTYIITVTGIAANGDRIYKTTSINRK